MPVHTFTQENINQGDVRYILNERSSNVTDDQFTFSVFDSQPNVIADNVFHIQWSLVAFHQNVYHVKEKEEMVQLKLIRRGDLKHYADVHCKTAEGSATSQDFGAFNGQIRFEEWETEKHVIIPITNDDIFDGKENFTVHLSDPSYTLMNDPFIATVIIEDSEDEVQITFAEHAIHLNETDGQVAIPVLRSGDLSREVSVVCYTRSVTAEGTRDKLLSGSDYFTRPSSFESKVTFPPDVGRATCNLTIIDDALYEQTERLDLIITDIQGGGKLGDITKMHIYIDGPNDEPILFLSQSSYMVLENNGRSQFEVVRQGSDLFKESTVWCGTRTTKPPSALPGEDFVSTSMQVTFAPGQTIAKCSVTLMDDLTAPRQEGLERFELFISDPIGGKIIDPSVSVITINDSNLDVTTVEFKTEKASVKETDNKIVVQLLRIGDLSRTSIVECQSFAGSALPGKDFIPIVKKTVNFSPGEKVKQLQVKIISDDVYEGDEVFYLILSDANSGNAHAVGKISKMEITITDGEDAAHIQFEKPVYSIREPAVLSEMVKANISVWRLGDKSGTSKVRVSTRDGSAISGIDYHGKSKELVFSPGEAIKLFEVEVLHSKKRDWNKMLSIVLGPDQPINATMGDPKVAVVQIYDHETSGSAVLPAPPVVVSLLHYTSMSYDRESPSPGYPLICVTACDENYPEYDETGPMCTQSGINSSSIRFLWEAAMPVDIDSVHPPFSVIKDSTLFTSVNGKVLENIYFGPKFLIRCVAQPIDNSGNLGIPLKSRPVQIGTNNGVCYTRGQLSDELSFGRQSHSFVASLRYVNSSDQEHPNTIHIHIKVPHQDGMLPLISTLPLHNVRYLLTEPIYRQQHLCSNLLVEGPHSNFGFLSPDDVGEPQLSTLVSSPHHLDEMVRDSRSLVLYRHLHLKSCSWTFDAWYHMTELVDSCGASVMSDFQARDTGQTYLTVHLPLYVSYIFATAPTGWTSLEHRTELEFSFFYNTVLWRTGLATDGHLKARLIVQRILIDNDGHLVVEFKTQAKFRGLFIMKHPALPGVTSRVASPETIPLTFALEAVWTENTFDGPNQMWKATSKYNLKDYTGDYSVELLPCTVSGTQIYVKEPTEVCFPHSLQKFPLPIGFQQASRPVPVVYSLSTVFQVLNNQKMFLTKPTAQNVKDMDYRGTFSKDQTVYGRVLWDPTQDLDSAYKLWIDRVYLCTGSEGNVPTFDPTGEDYGEGPQFGCIQRNNNLKYRFLLLDRSSFDAKDDSFDDVSFKAKFAYHVEELGSLQDIPGVDGFMFNVEPLYKADAGHLWYLQVMYSIGSSTNHRSKRSRSGNDAHRNGTNIHVLALKSPPTSAESSHKVAVVLPLITGVVLMGAGAWLAKKYKTWSHYRRCNTDDDMALRNSTRVKGVGTEATSCTEV